MEVYLSGSMEDVEIKERYIPKEATKEGDFELFCIYIIDGDSKLKLLFREVDILKDFISRIVDAGERMLNAR